MAEVTGFFRFHLKVSGEERPAIVEITAPGLKSEQVVHVVRLEWANLFTPGLSQNRLECLGWDQVEKATTGLRPTRAIGPHPVIFWS